LLKKVAGKRIGIIEFLISSWFTAEQKSIQKKNPKSWPKGGLKPHNKVLAKFKGYTGKKRIENRT
jgi:hypothetical protein